MVGFAAVGLTALMMIMLCLQCVFSFIQQHIHQNVKQVMFMQTHTVLALQYLAKKKGGDKGKENNL